MYKFYIKPFLDFIIALAGFIILFVRFFLFIVVLLSIVNKGNPFFFQSRPGLHGKIFKVIKFKTMNDRKDKEGNLLPMKNASLPLVLLSEKLRWMKFLNC